MDSEHPPYSGVPGGAVRGQPDPDGHPRLPRCARRRARGDLRGPVAGADRRARRLGARCSCRSRAATRTRRSSTGSAWRSRSSERWCSRRSASGGRASRKKRSSGSATRSRRRRPILAMSKATSESEHLKDMLVGNILAVSWKSGRPRSCTARSARSTSSSAASSSRSPWTPRAPRSAGCRSACGISLLRVVRLRRHLVGVDRRRLLVFCYLIVPSVAAMLSLTGLARGSRSGGRWARWSRHSACTVARAGPADRRDHCLHIWCDAHPDGRPAALHRPAHAVS